MPPSRRTALAVIGSSIIPLTAGCTVAGVQIGDQEATISETKEKGESEFEVWLENSGDSRLLFDASDVASVGKVKQGRDGSYHLSISLTDEGTSSISETMRTAGVDKNPGDFEIIQRFQGEVVYRASISPGLAENIAAGDWNGNMLMKFEDRNQAKDVRKALVTNDSG